LLIFRFRKLVPQVHRLSLVHERSIAEESAASQPMVRGSYGSHMMDDTTWRELCQRIMAEKDPEKLWTLVEQLNKTLETREQQLRGHEAAQPKDGDGTA
jgi:hypothetical protein